MNFIKKIYIKTFFKEQYQSLKNIEKNNKNLLIFDNKIKNKILEIQSNILKKKTLNILHSGHCGDIISSLALIKKLSETHECNLFININKKIPVQYLKHPAGNVYVNEKMYKMLEPLVKYQKYLKTVKVFNGESIDINFDLFRDFPLNINFNQARWYFHITGVHADLSLPYLESTKHKDLNNKIIFHRTFRYRNNFINYNFLEDLKDSYFIGTRDEYYDLQKSIKHLNFYECKDFLDMASIINSCKFFIGNSSIAFPIAEALKVPRILEASPEFPVLQISGLNGYDFYFQPHFEKLFKYLNQKND